MYLNLFRKALNYVQEFGDNLVIVMCKIKQTKKTKAVKLFTPRKTEFYTKLNLIRRSHKENVQIANKHMKKYSMLPVTRKMQIKTQMRKLTPTIMAKIKD